MPANVVVPEVGESIVDARVAKWLKKEGDAVAVGDPLVELETDKIDLEVAAPQAGVLGKIAHGDGADVKVGEVLGVHRRVRKRGDAPVAAAPARARPRSTAGADGDAEAATRRRKAATPAARNAARSRTKSICRASAAAATPAA